MPVRIETDLARVPSNMLGRITKAVERLDRWPNVSGAKPLTGNWAGHHRIRVGDWRIVFRIRGSDVIVVAIAHRKEVYDE